MPFPGESAEAYSDRTGCLRELAQTALDQLHSQPVVASRTPLTSSPPSQPAPRTGKRRILASS